MIFVTVGTHEQQFNRLISKIDEMKRDKIIDEEVIIQTGFSTYLPKFCIWSSLFSYTEMKKYIRDARIVITHGGPSSFISPLQIGKIPIVVPRIKEYDEHVNNHQVEFVNAVAERQGNILVAKDIEHLNRLILNYDELVTSMPNQMMSNNRKFNEELDKLAYLLVNRS